VLGLGEEGAALQEGPAWQEEPWWRPEDAIVGNSHSGSSSNHERSARGRSITMALCCGTHCVNPQPVRAGVTAA
jgi:hypothetical protein